MATDIISVSLYKTDSWKNSDLTCRIKACYNTVYLIVVHRKFDVLGRPQYKGRLATSLADGLTQLSQRVTPEGIGVEGYVLNWV